jgi:hypothetical protein
MDFSLLDSIPPMKMAESELKDSFYSGMLPETANNIIK